MEQSETTRLLVKWCGGDRQSLNELVPRVHCELHTLASHYMRSERANHTLQPTALVHEAFVRLIETSEVGWNSRAHFIAVAANCMRHILVDYARNRSTEKRNGGVGPLSLRDADGASGDSFENVLAVSCAMETLASIDQRKAQIAEMRWLAGMSIQEVADVLGVSTNTVVRDWQLARAWLKRELTRV